MSLVEPNANHVVLKNIRMSLVEPNVNHVQALKLLLLRVQQAQVTVKTARLVDMKARTHNVSSVQMERQPLVKRVTRTVLYNAMI